MSDQDCMKEKEIGNTPISAYDLLCLQDESNYSSNERG